MICFQFENKSLLNVFNQHSWLYSLQFKLYSLSDSLFRSLYSEKCSLFAPQSETNAFTSDNSSSSESLSHHSGVGREAFQQPRQLGGSLHGLASQSRGGLLGESLLTAAASSGSYPMFWPPRSGAREQHVDAWPCELCGEQVLSGHEGVLIHLNKVLV